MNRPTIRARFRSALLLPPLLLAAACGSKEQDVSELSAKVTANEDQLTTLTTSTADHDARLASITRKVAELTSASMESAAALQGVEDVVAISAVAGCYGRGHDAVVPGKEADQSAALTILQTCFTDDVQSEFRYFGNPAQPSDCLDGLPALVEYIAGFWANAGYHSARNVPGNVHVEQQDARHATLLYSGTTPHFSVAGDDTDPNPDVTSRPGFIDAISASYTSELERGDDQIWRTTHFTIDIEEVTRITGTYWIGQ
jgi:hypothetical protein